MARPLRIDVCDGVYHVTSRGLERRDIVRDDRDRVRWLELLDVVAVRRRWRVFAWVLLDNHYHIFLRTPQGDLSAGMHDLNSGYATAFNRRHARHGPLLQGRFKGILVERDYHYWELSRYIHLNPVRAGIVERPERFGWGSCPFYLETSGAPEWLAWEEVLSQHGRTIRAARREYARFLEDGVSSQPRSPLLGAVASTVLGSARFVKKVQAWLMDRLPDREIPAAKELRRAIGVDAVEMAVCKAFGARQESMRMRGIWGNDARAAAIYLCRKLTGESIALLGERFGGIGGQAISKTALQFAERLRHDHRLARLVRVCEDALSEKVES